RGPDGTEDRQRTARAGHERAGPEGDGAVRADADLSEVERQEGQHEPEGEHRRRLRETDDVQAGAPRRADGSGNMAGRRRYKARTKSHSNVAPFTGCSYTET